MVQEFRRSLMMGVFVCACGLAAKAHGTTVTRNIAYTSDSTGTYAADLYSPDGTGPFPAMVLIHGGSWRSGNKSELKRLGEDLATHGYLCLSIDYDVHPRSFPYSWQESRAAVVFLRQHAAEYKIDPARIAVLGTSAGGQLAALVALAPEGPAEAPASSTSASSSSSARATIYGAVTGDVAPVSSPPARSVGDASVQAALMFNGGYDLHPKAWLLRRYLGGRCEAIAAVCNDASPDDHVHAGAPPIFVGHGTADHLIPYAQATTFIERLQAAGDSVTPFIALGAGHSYWRQRRWYSENLAAAEVFLDRTLRKP